jgi:DNA-binding response OmpR family regulator
MTRTRYLLVLAKLQAEQRRMLGVFATNADLDLVVVEDSNQALLWLDRHEASVILFDASTPKAERLCHKARAKRSLSGVPILAMTQELTDVYTEKLYALGADDVVSASAWPALIARLRSLPRQDAPLEPPKLGRAVVADADRGRCDVIGHVLANAGFELRYASDERVLQYYSTQEDVRLVVANADLTAPRPIIERSRAAGAKAAWIIMSSKRDIEQHNQALLELVDVATISQNSPPDDLLFLANELTSGKSGSGRSSMRVLYGTTVAFRKSGTDNDDWGFTYNISAKGMYVRSLALPDAERVWLELRPPRAKERVRLEGEVIWSSPFGRAVGAAAPPGFAVRLTDGLGEGLTAWVECYEFYVGSKRAGVLVSEPPPAANSAPPAGEATTSEATASEAPASEAPAPSARPASPVELAQAIVGAYPEAKLPVSLPPEPAKTAPGIAAPVSAKPVMPMQTVVIADDAVGEDEPTAPGSSLRRDPRRNQSTVPPRRALEPVAAGPTRRSPWTWLSLALLASLGFLAVVLLTSREQRKPPPPVSQTAAAVSAPLPAVDSTRAREEPAPRAATDAAADGPLEASAVSGDGSELPAHQGWLLVESAAGGSVYSNGVLAGPTNQPLKVRCGGRFLRVGGDVPGQWWSDGVSANIACRSVTRVSIRAKTP